MINVMLPSGDIKQFENSVNMFDVAKAISNSLAKPKKLLEQELMGS